MIRKAGAIYGDSITPERAEQILYRCVHELKLSPFNCVFGIGSYTYEYVTRDTYGFAMKATAVVRGGKLVPIFKSPKTDNAKESKKSHVGIPTVWLEDSNLIVKQGCQPEELDGCAFEKVFEDGELLVDPTFDAIRARVRA